MQARLSKAKCKWHYSQMICLGITLKLTPLKIAYLISKRKYWLDWRTHFSYTAFHLSAEWIIRLQNHVPSYVQIQRAVMHKLLYLFNSCTIQAVAESLTRIIFTAAAMYMHVVLAFFIVSCQADSLDVYALPPHVHPLLTCHVHVSINNLYWKVQSQWDTS